MTGKLRSRDQGNASPPKDEVDEKLIGAAINADVILEPSQTDPRPVRGYAGVALPEPHDLPVIPSAEPAGAPQTPTSRPFARSDGLRLMPLSGFIWGGATQNRQGARPISAQPRVRGDHVILLVTRGSADIDFPRKRQPIGQGRIAFIPSGTAFSFQPPADIDGWALLLPPNLGIGLPVGFPLAFRQGTPHPADEPLLEPAFQALGQDRVLGPRASSATALHLGLLALALTRAVDKPQVQDGDHLQSLVARPLTESFLELAANHLADGRTIADMALELGCTQAQLDRACHDSRGRTPLELLYSLRLERAAQLLRDTDMPIHAIAQEIGYSGIGHFMRVFTAATGRTPEAFRAMAWSGTDGSD
ncbi:AraC family transcriptional regulator [Paracoccus litorisediminis]|uniref:Helix-turn-helix domain-containing protein n=1 Tax=Paracoccus litorisediminis TaxID=2006130 RepID=A0A844HIQ6_9RHOB|nr:AraC family transcriptional regulator [Paracoccus litorisediminis]MTH57681.1 helix-turn-helix domain-containing protein [Paracoccus litorisediminis]